MATLYGAYRACANFKRNASRSRRRKNHWRIYGNSISKAISFGWAKFARRDRKYHAAAQVRNRPTPEELD